MSYEPTNWKDGDLVTSAKLNKIEQGIFGAGVLVVGFDNETGALDKTWQEINDAELAVVWLQIPEFGKNLALICQVYSESENYGTTVIMLGNNGSMAFTTDSAEGYPVAEEYSSTDGDSAPNPEIDMNESTEN